MARKINFPKREILDKMEIITINVPTRHLALIETLVNHNVYPSRSEAIRAAINEWIVKEIDYHISGIESYLREMEEKLEKNQIRVPNGDGTHDIKTIIGEA